MPLPGEASGVLRRPQDWSLLSTHSLAYGYELSVTSLQMAMAFGALANGGWLMEPQLVREIRDRDGTPVRLGRPRAVRRAVPSDVAEALTPVLVDVVEDGTGARARMSNFRVAGKSGTTRATGKGGRYQEGAYHASFGAYFPADDPQLIVFVRLDRPRRSYFGGEAAAAVTLATLRTLLSARRAPIDREALALAARHAAPPPGNVPVARFAKADDPALEYWSTGPVPSATTGGTLAMIVPALRGVSVRVALRKLHKMGLRIRLEGGGVVHATVPGAGEAMAAGDTIRVVAHDHGASETPVPPGREG